MTQQMHSPTPDAAELDHVEPSGLSYDPKPYREARPYPADWYERTSIGYLYGLPGCADFAYMTAGWNIEGLIDFEPVPLDSELEAAVVTSDVTDGEEAGQPPSAPRVPSGVAPVDGPLPRAQGGAT